MMVSSSPMVKAFYLLNTQVYSFLPDFPAKLQIGMSSQLLTVQWASWIHRPKPEHLVFPHHDPCTCTLSRPAVTSPWFWFLMHKPSNDLASSLHPTGLPGPCFPPSHRAQNLPVTQCSPAHSSKQHTSDSRFCLSLESLLSTQAQRRFFFFPKSQVGWLLHHKHHPGGSPRVRARTWRVSFQALGLTLLYPRPPPACFSGLSASSTGPLSAHYTACLHGLKCWRHALCVGLLLGSLCPLIKCGASLVAQIVKNLPAMQEAGFDP